MEFADKAAEDYYRELYKKYGDVHLNTGGKLITIEGLKGIEKFLENIKKGKIK
mgnify:CR=1 FL=1